MKIKINHATLFFLFFIFLLFLNSSVYSQEVPIPTLVPYVNDFANVISQDYRNQIQTLSQNIEASTGAEIAVLTINSTQPMSIEEYAVKTFEKNGIGKKGVDNGILIVVAVQDRMWRIEVGYGLEGTINDAKAGRIGRDYMTTSFREGNYGEGFYNAVIALGNEINGTSTEPESVEWISILPIFIIFIPFVLIVVILLVVKMSAPKCPKCGTRMTAYRQFDFSFYRCPKCRYKKKEKRKRFFWFFVAAPGGWTSGGGGGGGGGFGGGGSGGGGSSGGY
jgi:uncharacterized protein